MPESIFPLLVFESYASGTDIVTIAKSLSNYTLYLFVAKFIYTKLCRSKFNTLHLYEHSNLELFYNAFVFRSSSYSIFFR